MPNIFNSKTEKKSVIVTNIRVIKIIAIILGLLIILGLIFLFWGLANSYNKLNLNKKIEDKTFEKNLPMINKFDFNEPIDAQLISTSLGPDSQILLRYLYKGKNTLVIIDVKSKKIRSIITLKKDHKNFISDEYN